MNNKYVKPEVVAIIKKSDLVTKESKDITPHLHTIQNS